MKVDKLTQAECLVLCAVAALSHGETEMLVMQEEVSELTDLPGAQVQGCFARLERLGLLERERDMGAASVTQVGLLASEGIAAHGEEEALPA